MVQVLNTTGLNYQLEKTITEAEERIILISPYLKLSNRIKELIEDKNRLKVDIRIVYGKSELNSKEYEWLTNLPFVRLSFCKNLHAKLYANENQCIVCSLNLYDFSQINNHEIGVLIIKEQEKDAYTSSLNEAQRLIRISTDNIQPLTTDKETTGSKESEKTNKESSDFTSAFHEEPLRNQNRLITDLNTNSKLTSTNLAKNHKTDLLSLYKKLIEAGYLMDVEGKYILTDAGIAAGAEAKPNRYKKGENYFLWPDNLAL